MVTARAGDQVGRRPDGKDPAGKRPGRYRPARPLDDLAEIITVPFVSGQKKGKGLGVPTAKRIIESHGGEMSYTSESGVGTTWDIRLPRAAVNL